MKNINLCKTCVNCLIFIIVILIVGFIKGFYNEVIKKDE